MDADGNGLISRAEFQDTLNDDRVLAGGVCWEKLEPLCSITVLGRFGRLQSEGLVSALPEAQFDPSCTHVGRFFFQTHEPEFEAKSVVNAMLPPMRNLQRRCILERKSRLPPAKPSLGSILYTFPRPIQAVHCSTRRKSGNPKSKYEIPHVLHIAMPRPCSVDCCDLFDMMAVGCVELWAQVWWHTFDL